MESPEMRKNTLVLHLFKGNYFYTHSKGSEKVILAENWDPVKYLQDMYQVHNP